MWSDDEVKRKIGEVKRTNEWVKIDKEREEKIGKKGIQMGEKGMVMNNYRLSYHVEHLIAI